MTRTILPLCIWMLACLFANKSSAEETLRPVTAAYTIGVGSAEIADTYLTPLKYKGWNATLNYERMQAMRFNPSKWVMRYNFSADAGRSENPSGNAAMWHGGIDFSWSMMHRIPLPHNLAAAIGGGPQLLAGCLYNKRNGNNPVAAKASVTVNITGYLAWQTRIWQIPVTVRWQPSLPVTGIFFSPDYGELYYEIYLGNHSRLAHCAWWGNYFRFDNLLAADIHFGATSLRVGYSGRIYSTKINNITSRIMTNSFVIGISGEWMSINPRKKLSPDVRTISAVF